MKMQIVQLFKPLGVDLFCLGKKFLVFNLVSRNIKTKYHRSVLGVLWTLLSPLSTAAVFYFVFKVVMNIQIPYYLAFILSGILPWSFFNQTVLEGMESIVGNLGLVSKVPIPIQVFPFVGALTNLVTLLISIPIVFAAAIFSGVSLGSSSILVFFYLGALFLMAYSAGVCLSIFFVLLRDLRHLMGIALQLLFYATPIVYRESMVPEKYKWIAYVNPIAFIFIDLRTVLVMGEWPPLQNIAVVCGWTSLSVGLALLTYKTMANNLVERI